jgi:hypothetical protein
MNRSLPPIPAALSALALAARGSSQSRTVSRLAAGTSTQPSAPSGLSQLTAQALLTYLRGSGVCDACAIELITDCARRAREAN